MSLKIFGEFNRDPSWYKDENWYQLAKHNHDCERKALLKGHEYLSFAITFTDTKDGGWGTEGFFFHLKENVDVDHSDHQYFSSGVSAGVFERKEIKAKMKEFVKHALQKHPSYNSFAVYEVYDYDPMVRTSGGPEGPVISEYQVKHTDRSIEAFCTSSVYFFEPVFCINQSLDKSIDQSVDSNSVE